MFVLWLIFLPSVCEARLKTWSLISKLVCLVNSRKAKSEEEDIWMMGEEGGYSIFDFIQSLSPLTLSSQSPLDEAHIWTFWSKEDDKGSQNKTVFSCKLLTSPISLHSHRRHNKTRHGTPYQQRLFL